MNTKACEAAVRCVRLIERIACEEHNSQSVPHLLADLQADAGVVTQAVLIQAGQRGPLSASKEVKILGKSFTSYLEFVGEWSGGLLAIACSSLSIDPEGIMEGAQEPFAGVEPDDVDETFFQWSTLGDIWNRIRQKQLASERHEDAADEAIREIFAEKLIHPILACLAKGFSPSSLNLFASDLSGLQGKATAEVIEAAKLSGKIRLEGKLQLGENARSWKAGDYGLLVEKLTEESGAYQVSRDCFGLSDAEREHVGVKVFYCYARADSGLRDALANHLSVLRREGLISEWHDRNICGGEEWQGQIDSNLRKSQVVLLLLSADFFGSDYCHDVEMSLALERNKAGEAAVIPIFMRPCGWKHTGLSNLQGYPRSGTAVTECENQDAAMAEIVDGVREVISRFQ